MNLEVIEFYLTDISADRRSLTGTLRIKLPDLGINLLGIGVSKGNNTWYFKLPSRNGKHHETGEPVTYPVFTFEDKERHKAFVSALREKGRAFIEMRLANTENPLILIQKPQPQSNEAEAHKAQESAIALKESGSIAKSKAMKEWQDPPKKTIARGASKFARV